MKKAMFILIGIVIGIVGTSYAAYKLTASQVSFDKSKTNLNSDNVQDSIDEMVDMLKYGDAEEGDILSGKTALVKGKKITGNFDFSEKIPSIEVDFTVDYSAWTNVTIPYNENYKTVTIYNTGGSDVGVRTLLIYKGSTQIGTLTKGQSGTYNMESGKNIIIKPANGGNTPYGYFVLNP